MFKTYWRAFSTLKSDGSSSKNSSGLAVLSDADKDKLSILKGKSGIYLWTKLNHKKYVGSSVALKRRLLEYYNVNRILNE